MAALLPHCAGPSRYFGFLEILFRQQLTWARASDPVQALTSLARQGGLTSEAVQACLADQQVMNQVLAASLQGEREFKIKSTPSLVINGKLHTGSLSFEDLDKVLRPLAAGRS
jgi:protein-disulfide isomerase